MTNSSEHISCDDHGQCLCKSLVIGTKCDQCIAQTYGLHKNNVAGCTNCFCFGRSHNCKASDLTWGQIRSYGPRNLSVEYVPAIYTYVVVRCEKYQYPICITLVLSR